MTGAERTLASRLLDVAAQEFHEHGCNDMDPEYFDGLTDVEIAQLLDGYNAWKRGETGETCGDSEEDYCGIKHIGDDMWMAYLAAVIGRDEAAS